MFKLKLLKNKKATAEIVGTALFLVILFFFFTNVFLWHDRATREMDQVTADKMNSAVRIETVVGGGDPATASAEDVPAGDYQGTFNPSSIGGQGPDGTYRTIGEEDVADDPWGLEPPLYKLQIDYTFDTGIDTPQKLRLIAGVGISVYATFNDSTFEGCKIAAYDWDDAAYIDTGLQVMQGFRWSNMSLLTPEIYISPTGQVKLAIVDSTSGGGTWGATTDEQLGTLQIDYMEVRGDPIALEVTNLGGLDVALSRLWITETTNPESDHIYADLEPLGVNGLITAGSQKIIVLSDTRDPPTGSPKVSWEEGKIKVGYVPPAGQTLTFKVITKHGNSAACSYSFPTG